MNEVNEVNTIGYGVCPVCSGTKQIKLSERELNYSWNKGKTHKACHNCGGHTMAGIASGRVPLRKDGTPCIHEYTARGAGRCYTIYTCNHCGYQYDIDSSD